MTVSGCANVTVMDCGNGGWRAARYRILSEVLMPAACCLLPVACCRGLRSKPLQALSALIPYIRGKVGISSGGARRLPGRSRILAKHLSPFVYGYSSRAVILSPVEASAV